MPQGSNRRAVTYADRYVIVVGGCKCERTWRAGKKPEDVYTPEEKKLKLAQRIEDGVIVFDTKLNRYGSADPMLDTSSFPMVAIDGDTLYTLGGEGGRKMWHPATFQIGKIRALAHE